MIKQKFLLPHQSYFLQAPYLFPDTRFFIFTAGYGSGKTSSISSAILYDAAMLQGKKDREGHRPRILLGGVSLGHLKKTTLAYILADLEQSKTKYNWDSKDSVLSIGNVDIYCVSLSKPSAIMGYDAVLSYMDEVDDLGSVGAGSAIDMTYEAIKSVNERTRQVVTGYRKPHIKMASTSQGQRGLYRAVTNFKKENTSYVRIKARTKDNFYLPEDYVAAQYKFYSPVEAAVYLEGEFLSVGANRIFPDFDWNRNFIRLSLDTQLKANEEVFWAQDFNKGYNRGCAGVLRGDTIYIVKRYEFTSPYDAPAVLRHDFPNNKIMYLPDASSNDDILTYAGELKRYNIYWNVRSKNPPIEDSVFLVNKLMFTGRLIFTELARESAEMCALGMRNKAGDVPKGDNPRSPIHDIDAVRMLCYYLVFRPSMKDIRMLTVQRHLQLQKDMEDDGEYIENGIVRTKSGYTVISPGAM